MAQSQLKAAPGRKLKFMARILQYGPYSMVVLKDFRNRKSSWEDGDLRAEFTDRISVYGPYSITYLVVQAFGRKSEISKSERRPSSLRTVNHFTVRILEG